MAPEAQPTRGLSARMRTLHDSDTCWRLAKMTTCSTSNCAVTRQLSGAHMCNMVRQPACPGSTAEQASSGATDVRHRPSACRNSRIASKTLRLREPLALRLEMAVFRRSSSLSKLVLGAKQHGIVEAPSLQPGWPTSRVDGHG